MKMKRAYNMLLRLYPTDYRTCFAAEMLKTFEEAAAWRRKQGMLGSVYFSLAELVGLLIGAAAEWIAKLSTDRSIRGRCLPDLRMMRPPGVTRQQWFARTCATDIQPNPHDEVVEAETQITTTIGNMVHAIANHDFPKARFYSDREREIRAHLLWLREGQTIQKRPDMKPPLE
jgi:hypothetical protein